jgi:hypothetical protein
MANTGHPTRPARLPIGSAQGSAMLGSSLTDWERNELTGLCGYWLASVSEAKLMHCLSQVLDAFKGWKNSQTDSAGMVSVSVGGSGLLSWPMKTERRRASELEPWQCAGPDVSDDIALAFKLWLDNYDLFRQVLFEHGIPLIFAIVGVVSRQNATPQSLIRLNGFLSAWLMAESRENAKHAEKHRNSTRHLPKARATAADKKSRDAAGRQVKARQLAIAYWSQCPAASMKDVIKHLRTYGEFDGWKADSSFENAIKGMKTKALRSLDTRLPR